MSECYCFIDFGSTFTKVCVIDIQDCRIVSRSQAPSTVNTDITIGLEEALSRLTPPSIFKECKVIRATSSAAGGLKMVAMGLVPDLTSEAANRAALGAGAKVERVFSYRLTNREVREMIDIKPDIILLAGGTDGGNCETIVYNAKRIAQTNIVCPVVVSGNKEVVDEVEDILIRGGQKVYVADNVMPEIGKLAVESARENIREVFLEHIVHAKGLDKAKALVDEIIMPTPMAVLNATTVLAEGTSQQRGVGDTMVVDVGGATTDIHSVAWGTPIEPTVVLKGLPEPFAKRTVEGDLGIRINAPTIFHIANKSPSVSNLFAKYEAQWAERRANYIATHINNISQEQQEIKFDFDLSRAATAIATNRHVGRIETVYTISGAIQVQIGKDLTRVRRVIGTGGIFAYGSDPAYILKGTERQTIDHLLLKPEKPDFFIDSQYILFAAGLLSDLNKEASLQIIKRYLQRLGPDQ